MHVLCVRWPWCPCVGLCGLILLSECWTLSIHLVVSESDCVDWFYCPCVWLSGLIVLKDNLSTIVWWDSLCVSWNDIWGISVSVTIIYGLHPTKNGLKAAEVLKEFSEFVDCLATNIYTWRIPFQHLITNGGELCMSMMDTFEPFTEADIWQLLKKSSNSFCAVDSLPMWLVKDCLDVLNRKSYYKYS